MRMTSQSITPDYFPAIIAFDQEHLCQVMVELGVPTFNLPPPLSLQDLEQAQAQGDHLEWLLVDETPVGYFWFQYEEDHLYIAGCALKKEFYGKGLADYVGVLAEERAKAKGLSVCRLMAIPNNYRVLAACVKSGYRMVDLSREKGRFLLVMEKKL